jgi:cell division protein FtsQ
VPGSNLPRLIHGEVLVDEETRRRINRSHFRRSMAILGLLATLGIAVLVYLSPLLRVQDVQVEGSVNLAPHEVEDLLEISGDSMLRLDTGAARSRLEEQTLIQSATVERDWPNSVKVTIVERTPWATWMVGNKPYVIDSEGMVLPEVAVPGGLAISHVDATNSPAEGEHVDTNAIALAHSLLEQVPPRLQMGITLMEWSDTGGMTITTDAGYKVAIGDGDDLDYKLTVWAQIDSTVGRSEMGGHVLDLRYGDRPALQVTGGTP